MTPEEQKQLDEQVAREVMGLVPCDNWRRVNFGSAGGAALVNECAHEDGKCYPTKSFSNMSGSYGGVPPYSSRIHSAMEVVEKMRDRNQDLEVQMTTYDLAWVVSFAEDKMDGAGGRTLGQGVASSLPEAICRAALAAIEDRRSRMTPEQPRQPREEVVDEIYHHR